MCESERIEKLILRISLISGILFVILELLMAIYSQSQSILMDTAFDAAELIVIAASLFLTPLLYKPITEKHPFGYAQCESLFMIIKGFMLIAVTISLIFSNIQVMINGGKHVNLNLVFMLELILSLLSFMVLLVLKYYSKRVHSPIITAEVYGWKLDVICGLGISIAFLVPILLKETPLAQMTPYFDQIVAIILATMMLPEPIKMIIKAIKDILLFAPDEETINKVKTITMPICLDYSLEVTFVDVVRTGRKTWVVLTLKSMQSDLSIAQFKEVYDLLILQLQIEFEDINLELVPALEN